MKKIITSILAFSLTAALFTGCQQTDNSDGNSVVESGTSESETVNETTQETAVTTTTSETTTAELSETDYLSANYEDILRAYYDATSSGDYEAMLKTSYPAKIVEGMLGIMKLDPDGFDNALEGDGSTYEITDIIEQDSMTQEVLDAFVMDLNNIAGGLDMLREHGGDPNALSHEEREKISDVIMGRGAHDATDITDYYSSSKGYDVTVRYTKDGEPDEDYFFVFYVDGEGWKVNNSIRQIFHKAKNDSLNVDAKNLYSAFNVALTEADEEGMFINGLYIIGSDDSMNYNVPSEVETAVILKKAANYIDGIDDYDYFIIVNNGHCIYSASDRKDDDDDSIGTRPECSIPVSTVTENGSIIETKDTVFSDFYSLEELFEVAKKAIE